MVLRSNVDFKMPPVKMLTSNLTMSTFLLPPALLTGVPTALTAGVW
jgi:hypothetical protein